MLHLFGKEGVDEIQFHVNHYDIPAIEKKLQIGINVYTIFG